MEYLSVILNVNAQEITVYGKTATHTDSLMCKLQNMVRQTDKRQKKLQNMVRQTHTEKEKVFVI